MQMPGWLVRFLLGRGVLAELTVVGRRSGLQRTAVVNKAPAPGGGWFVAAGDETHQWAHNLRAAGRCGLSVRGVTDRYTATELSGDERARAVRALAPPFGRGTAGMRGPVFHLERE